MTLLVTALVGALLPPDVPAGHKLRNWLDSWSGVGHVLDAMTAAGHHVELRNRCSDGGRSSTARQCSIHARRGRVGTDVFHWRAVQIGALDVLKRPRLIVA
jgi:hypothetical protein